jgi:hypothetical protein
MKAEHRKQLETNTLADSLGKMAHGFQQGVPRGLWLIVGGVAVIVVLFYTWRYFSERSQRISSGLWYKWDQLDGVESIDEDVRALGDAEKQHLPFMFQSVKEGMDLKRLEKFVQENGSSEQGRLARFQLARLYLYEGLRDLGQDRTRARAREHLTKGAKLYAELVKDSRNIPVLHQEALLNCAKANESLGDLDEASKLYKQLQITYPKSNLGEVAQKQIERLEKDASEIKVLDTKLKEVPPPPAPPPTLPELPAPSK